MSNEGNIKASILLIPLKCIASCYSNWKESFTGRLFSNQGPLKMLFHFFFFFDILFIVFFTRLLSKIYEKAILFQLKFKKSISRCILQEIRRSNILILKWGPLKHKVKSWKIWPFLELFFQKWKMLTFWIFHESNISLMIFHFL